MALTSQKIGTAGGLPQATTVPTYAAPLASDTLTPGPSTFLHVKVGATATTVTVTAATACSQGVLHDLVATGLVSTERLIGPIPADRFGRPVDGLAAVVFSQITGVTVAVVVL